MRFLIPLLLFFALTQCYDVTIQNYFYAPMTMKYSTNFGPETTFTVPPAGFFGQPGEVTMTPINPALTTFIQYRNLFVQFTPPTVITTPRSIEVSAGYWPGSEETTVRMEVWDPSNDPNFPWTMTCRVPEGGDWMKACTSSADTTPAPSKTVTSKPVAANYMILFR